MRLIDADALKEQINIMQSLGANIPIMHMIENAPTVEPKHGHWIARAKSMLNLPIEACSECAEWSLGFDKKYCPHCGAKMDKVERGEDGNSN